MRILVHEVVTGGGLDGYHAPAALAREGAAMLQALVADLHAIGAHQIVSAGAVAPEGLDALIASVDAVWLIAPESERCLERLAAQVEGHGKMLIGPPADAIARAADKWGVAERLRTSGVPHPETRLLTADADGPAIARTLGYPLVVKPRRGAGCHGVSRVRTAAALPPALDRARQAAGTDADVLLQRYVPGVAASVSLLADGHRAVPLAVNAQHVSGLSRLSYDGGATPLAHPSAGKAIDAALRSCAALPGLRGLIGVDVVLTPWDAVVIEVNPRVTTAYLGVRSVVHENVPSLAIAACEGRLPSPPVARRSVQFTAAGELAIS
jgi:predicted ATP-grasp superfamily ATP-dependent carboligase